MAFELPGAPAGGTTAQASWAESVNNSFTALNSYFSKELLLGEAVAPISGITMAARSQVESSGGDPKPNWMVAAFDKDADEGLQWEFIMPRLFGVTAKLYVPYYMASVTSGTVCFSAQIASMSDTDAGAAAKAFASANAATVTVPGTAGTIDLVEITMTNFDSSAALDLCTLYQYRDGSEDTAAGDILLRTGVYLTYNLIST